MLVFKCIHTCSCVGVDACACMHACVCMYMYVYVDVKCVCVGVIWQGMLLVVFADVGRKLRCSKLGMLEARHCFPRISWWAIGSPGGPSGWVDITAHLKQWAAVYCLLCDYCTS